MADDIGRTQQPHNDQGGGAKGPLDPLQVVRYIKYPLQVIAYLGGALILYVFRPAANNADTSFLLAVYAGITVVCLVVFAVLHSVLERAARRYADLLLEVAKRRRAAEEAYKKSREEFRAHYYPLAELILGVLSFTGNGKTVEDILRLAAPTWTEVEVVRVLGILVANNMVIYPNGEPDRYRRISFEGSLREALEAGN